MMERLTLWVTAIAVAGAVVFVALVLALALTEPPVKGFERGWVTDMQLPTLESRG